MATAIAIVPTSVRPGYRASMRPPTLKSSQEKRSCWIREVSLLISGTRIETRSENQYGSTKYELNTVWFRALRFRLARAVRARRTATFDLHRLDVVARLPVE